MPRSPYRRFAAVTLACLLASGGAAALAPGAVAQTSMVVSSTSSARSAGTLQNGLVGGERLWAGERITSNSGEAYLVMQYDGNAVVYDYSDRPLWSTGTQGSGNRLEMQYDGNAVVYSADERPLWSTGTAGDPDSSLILEDSGELKVVRTDYSVAWSSFDSQAPVLGDTLHGGAELRAGEQLTSTDGGSRAVMQGDGNFVVYSGGSARWSAGTSGAGNRLAMQTDGNAVIYSAGGGVRWQSGTSGDPGARMVVQNDGNLVIYSASGRPLWSSSAPAAPVVRDVLSGNGELRSGQQLVSTDGGSRAVMQGDGNFVVYSRDSVRWSAGTSGAGNRLAMQSDGNAVVYSASGRALWQSGTGGTGGARMVMQNDGNLVIYSPSNRPLWSSYTPPAPAIADTLFSGNELGSGRSLRSSDGGSEAAMQSDGNLVVYSRGGVRWNAGTSGAGNRLVMQGDGNAVVYSDSSARWQSGTSGNPGARMVMQNDGNLVIYSASGSPLWQSNQPARGVRPDGPVRTCESFRNAGDWPEANRWFQTYANAGNLDGDGDGVPCEDLRGAPRS